MHPQTVSPYCRIEKVFSRGVSILLTPAHETQPRQNPVLLVSSRAGKGSQSFSSHLGRYNHLETILPQNEAENRRDISRYVVPSNAADRRPRNEKNAAFEDPLANRPLQRSRYRRCARKTMGKKSAAAIHRHTLSLAPNSITLLRAQRLSHQGVASQHEKPNEGAGFFFLSLSRSICSSIVGSYVNVSTTQHPVTRAKRSAVPIARIIISPFP